MKILDAKGQKCPVPLIMTKKALQEIQEDETLEIHIDNETSVKNVTRFLEDHQMKVQTVKQGETYRLTVCKSGTIPEETRPEEWCSIPAALTHDYCIAFQKNTLGQGSDELGQVLIKAFINTLPETDHKPRTLLFLNSGIFLALEDSPVLESLRKLEQEGCRILVCGTCLDFYHKKPSLGVGIVSNMYDILTSMSSSAKVLFP